MERGNYNSIRPRTSLLCGRGQQKLQANDKQALPSHRPSGKDLRGLLKVEVGVFPQICFSLRAQCPPKSNIEPPRGKQPGTPYPFLPCLPALAATSRVSTESPGVPESPSLALPWSTVDIYTIQLLLTHLLLLR